MKKLKPLAKSVLILLELTAVASATDAANQKKIFGSGHSSDLAKRTALIISNKEMENIMKIIKSFTESGLKIKGVSEIIQNEAKGQKSAFLGMLLGTLGAILLGNMLAVKGAIATQAGKGKIRAGEDPITAGQNVYSYLIL